MLICRLAIGDAAAAGLDDGSDWDGMAPNVDIGLGAGPPPTEAVRRFIAG